METFDLYKDIKTRTKGEIYIAVVGPVRTGKSTFIKRFMDLMVIPNIEDVHSKERAIDELPQSAAGKTIMTSEPKFIPKEAVEINFGEEVKASVRLIDCVGYMVNGASGHIEDNQERLVKTPWFDYEIPFTEAAEIGTQKVINEHSTIGIVITTDGSFGDIPRENYKEAEERTIHELKQLGKPFIVLLNTSRPYSEETHKIVETMALEHNVNVLPVNCEQLRKEDIHHIMEKVLTAFPVTRLNFYLPKWVEMLPNDYWIKKDFMQKVRELLKHITYIRDIGQENLQTASEYIRKLKLDHLSMDSGVAEISVDFDQKYYYQILSDMVGMPIEGEYQLIHILKELSEKKQEYEKVGETYEQVKQKGYGIVTPSHEEITLETPELIKHGNKYGVKIKAIAPSIHIIKADIQTEIAPIVGTKEQAEDLIQYIENNTRNSKEGIWETNIFGKSIGELVRDGISTKVNKLTDDSQVKLQETIQKVINDSNGGLVCIII